MADPHSPEPPKSRLRSDMLPPPPMDSAYGKLSNVDRIVVDMQLLGIPGDAFRRGIADDLNDLDPLQNLRLRNQLPAIRELLSQPEALADARLANPDTPPLSAAPPTASPNSAYARLNETDHALVDAKLSEIAAVFAARDPRGQNGIE